MGQETGDLYIKVTS